MSKKLAITLAAILALGILVLPALAETFDLPAGTTIKAITVKEGNLYWTTVSWSGFSPDEFEHYRATPRDADGKKIGWTPRYDVRGKSSIKICSSQGNEFQFLKDGKWSLLTPEGFHNPLNPVTLIGIKVDCRDPRGCKLAILQSSKAD